MTQGFQQQNPSAGFSIPKSCPKPQHGQKADKAATKLTERRAFEPRPGH